MSLDSSLIIWLPVATEDIDTAEELFTLPYSLTLTVENSAYFARNHEKLQVLPHWAALVLVLIFEYGQDLKSQWAPYLKLLPDRMDTLMYWSDAELSELQGSEVLNKIGRQEAEDMFEKVLWPLAGDDTSQFGCYTESFTGPVGKDSFIKLCHRMAALIFAYGFDFQPCVSSSSEGDALEDEDESQRVMMVPLADLLNADGDLNNASRSPIGLMLSS